MHPNRWTKATMALLMAVGLASCATAGAGSATANPSVITAEELAGVPELNALEAVQRLRPRWLRGRGQASFTAQQGVRVYVSGVLRGYAGELASIRAQAIESMRFLDGREATARYGTDHGDGAILVELK